MNSQQQQALCHALSNYYIVYHATVFQLMGKESKGFAVSEKNIHSSIHRIIQRVRQTLLIFSVTSFSSGAGDERVIGRFILGLKRHGGPPDTIKASSIDLKWLYG
jgi:hypothetical protein